MTEVARTLEKAILHLKFSADHAGLALLPGLNRAILEMETLKQSAARWPSSEGGGLAADPGYPAPESTGGPQKMAGSRDRRIESALRGILEIGKRDTSNPKYDGYFNEARAALAAPPAQVPELREKIAVALWETRTPEALRNWAAETPWMKDYHYRQADAVLSCICSDDEHSPECPQARSEANPEPPDCEFVDGKCKYCHSSSAEVEATTGKCAVMERPGPAPHSRCSLCGAPRIALNRAGTLFGVCTFVDCKDPLHDFRENREVSSRSQQKRIAAMKGGPPQPGLLPCPFCGSKAEIVKNSFPPKNRWRHPSCTKEGCPAHVVEQDEPGWTPCDASTDEEASSLWNRRASVDPQTLGERMGDGAPARLLRKIEGILGRCVFDQPDMLDYDEAVGLIRDELGGRLGCNGTDHRLSVIYEPVFGSCEDVVVRWCADCGAVVVDVDCDGRTSPGAIVPMRFPNMTYPNQRVKP